MSNRVFLRTALAIVLSPLSILFVLPASGVIVSLAQGAPSLLNDLRMNWGLAVATTIFAYPAMLLFGLPTYLVLRHFQLASIWTAAATGAIVTMIMPFTIQAVVLLENLLRGMPIGLQVSNLHVLISNPSMILSAFDLLGSVVGVVFWVIASPRIESQTKFQNPA